MLLRYCAFPLVERHTTFECREREIVKKKVENIRVLIFNSLRSPLRSQHRHHPSNFVWVRDGGGKNELVNPTVKSNGIGGHTQLYAR